MKKPEPLITATVEKGKYFTSLIEVGVIHLGSDKDSTTVIVRGEAPTQKRANQIAKASEKIFRAHMLAVFKQVVANVNAKATQPQEQVR